MDVDVCFDVHRVDVTHLFDHPVQQVHPPQAHLGVQLVRLRVVESLNRLLSRFVLQRGPDTLSDLLDRQFFLRLSTLQLLECPFDVGLHLSGELFGLLLYLAF